jgi:hypothetical protein
LHEVERHTFAPTNAHIARVAPSKCTSFAQTVEVNLCGDRVVKSRPIPAQRDRDAQAQGQIQRVVRPLFVSWNTEHIDQTGREPEITVRATGANSRIDFDLRPSADKKITHYVWSAEEREAICRAAGLKPKLEQLHRRLLRRLLTRPSALGRVGGEFTHGL